MVLRNVSDMYTDRRLVAGNRAMEVVRAYEHLRGADVNDVSQGRDPRLRECLELMGLQTPPVPSADLISVLGDETRIIEVKGRGSSGPLSVIEREHDTFIAASDTSWLYVVWNTTQPRPYRLVLIQDPQRLPWVQTRAAQRPPGAFRGVRHEAEFECPSDDVGRLGVEVSLAGLKLPDKTTA